jgi:hypothetical protein
MRRHPLQDADGLSDIGLDELDAVAALRRRFDAKYLLSRHALPELLERLGPTHRVLEIERLRSFEYRTTYFDTPELEAFRHHLQGRRRRLKVRVRHYVDSGRCSFELKLQGPRGSTVKHRLPCDPELRQGLRAESLTALARWVGGAYGRPPPAPLGPTLEILYTRTTLVAPEARERVTVDVDLRMRRPGGDLYGRLDGELAVVESKSARGLAMAARQLHALGARRLETMSKYCLGVLLAHGAARGNALLPVLRHCRTHPARRP